MTNADALVPSTTATMPPGDTGALVRSCMPDIDVPTLVERWQAYGAHNRTKSAQHKQAGDWYGADLAIARAETREAAADLLQRFHHDPMHAAKVMHANAVRCSQRDMPIAEASVIDGTGLDYTRARTWQVCAREIDPSLPEVQVRWT